MRARLVVGEGGVLSVHVSREDFVELMKCPSLTTVDRLRSDTPVAVMGRITAYVRIGGVREPREKVDSP